MLYCIQRNYFFETNYFFPELFYFILFILNYDVRLTSVYINSYLRQVVDKLATNCNYDILTTNCNYVGAATVVNDSGVDRVDVLKIVGPVKDFQ